MLGLCRVQIDMQGLVVRSAKISTAGVCDGVRPLGLALRCVEGDGFIVINSINQSAPSSSPSPSSKATLECLHATCPVPSPDPVAVVAQVVHGRNGDSGSMYIMYVDGTRVQLDAAIREHEAKIAERWAYPRNLELGRSG